MLKSSKVKEKRCEEGQKVIILNYVRVIFGKEKTCWGFSKIQNLGDMFKG